MPGYRRPVTLTLTVDSAAWNRRVDSMAARIDGLVPVVKGNGYGFGRDWLAERASLLAPTMAVGTIFEVDSVPSNYTPIVLTPALSVPRDLRGNAILTVGSTAHVEAVGQASDTLQRRVLVKIRSSMNRYGSDVGNLDEMFTACDRGRLDVVGVSIHPPLSGTAADHRREIEGLISRIDPALPVHVSHLDEVEYSHLRSSYPDRTFFLRVGTALWHADKSELHLTADVLDVRRVDNDGVAGYRSIPVQRGSSLVVIGCGTAHGVTPLADGRSPFHFERQRLEMLEPPHMHSSMCVLAPGQSGPSVGDRVDVQRPLTMTSVDVVHWA